MAQQRFPKAEDAFPWSKLSPELLECIADNLLPNEAACNLRLVDKATAAALRQPKYTNIRLSQPVPHHAFARQWGTDLRQPDRTSEPLRQLTLEGRRKLRCLTAVSGSVANLEVAVASTCGWTQISRAQMWAAAAAAGALDVCRWLRAHGSPPCLGAVGAAAEAGQRRVCEWLLVKGISDSFERAVEGAARGGHVQLMEWLIQHWGEEPADSKWLIHVATGCDLATLQRFYVDWIQPAEGEGFALEYGHAIIAAAACSPTPDWRAKVEWLETRGHAEEKTQGACLRAAECQDAHERLMWLRQRGYPATREVTTVLARRGDTVTLQYLLSEELFPALTLWNTVLRSAHSGHVGVLEVLLATGQLRDLAQAEGGRFLLAAAARGGHLAAVKWVFEMAGARQDLLDDGVSEAAAESGNLELMSWLHERGCQWTERAVSEAAGSGCEAALEQLVVWGCPMPADGSPFELAVDNCDLPTLRCLKRLGCPWGPPGEVFAQAVANTASIRPDDILQILRLLLNLGCPVDWQRAVEEAEAVMSEVLEYDEETPVAEVREWIWEQRGHVSQTEDGR